MHFAWAPKHCLPEVSENRCPPLSDAQTGLSMTTNSCQRRVDAYLSRYLAGTTGMSAELSIARRPGLSICWRSGYAYSLQENKFGCGCVVSATRRTRLTYVREQWAILA